MPIITSGKNVPPKTAPANMPPCFSAACVCTANWSDSHPAIGWITARDTIPTTSTVSVGVTNISALPFTRARICFSSQLPAQHTSSTAITPPLPGTNAWPNNVTLASAGIFKIPANATPNAGVPPNSLLAL